MSTRVPEQICQSCGRSLTAVSTPGPEDPQPSPGDATVCLYCGHLMIFTDEMTLRLPNDQEIYELGGRPDILNIMAFIQEYQKRYQ